MANKLIQIFVLCQFKFSSKHFTVTRCNCVVDIEYTVHQMGQSFPFSIENIYYTETQGTQPDPVSIMQQNSNLHDHRGGAKSKFLGWVGLAQKPPLLFTPPLLLCCLLFCSVLLTEHLGLKRETVHIFHEDLSVLLMRTRIFTGILCQKTNKL